MDGHGSPSLPIGIPGTGGGLCVLPRSELGEAWFCGNVQKGCIPRLLPCSSPCTLLSLALTVTGWGQSCPAGSIRASGRLPLGGVPILEGPPGTAAQLGTRGSPPTPGLGRFNRNTRLPKEPRGWTPAPLKAQLLHPVFQDLGAWGPAGFFHRVIKCQSPTGRQRQLPGLQIRVPKEAGCAQGQEAARPRTCPPA